MKETRQALMFREMELPFRYDRGDSGAAWPVEQTGGGVGIADFDGDGRPDLFFAQGVPLPFGKQPNSPADVFLRNLGDRQFEELSELAGLQCKGYGLGVTVADYDADGFPDVYVTRYGANTLWHNQGDGHFLDATVEAGLGLPLWSLGAAFADYDDDGNLDLFVANYAYFDPAKAPFAHDAMGKPDYGVPAIFAGEPDVLYHCDGAGHFTDVTAQAGLADQRHGMGVLATDFDQDGRIDFLVANDAEPNNLWHNLGDGKFEDVAVAWGVAVNAEGHTEANMGIAYGDSDGDGKLDIIISHLVGEHHTLWRARPSRDGTMFYRDETFEAGIGIDSRKLTGWGTSLSDFDHDGLLDLIVVNGHPRREPNQTYTYENPPILWHNIGGGRFRNVTATAGPYFQTQHQSRGLAVGDLDGDGRLDLVVVSHYSPSVALWNETPPRGSSLVVQLTCLRSNRDAIGSRVTVTVGDRTLIRTLDSGGSYISSNDPKLHFGIGRASIVDRLEVRWPCGRVQSWTDVPAGTILQLREDAEPRSSPAESQP